MTIILALMAASILLGFAAGIVFRMWIMVLASLFLALLIAFVLHLHDFEFFLSLPIIAGCLLASQFAYMVAATITSQVGCDSLSAKNEIDGDPGDNREQSIHDEQSE